MASAEQTVDLGTGPGESHEENGGSGLRSTLGRIVAANNGVLVLFLVGGIVYGLATSQYFFTEENIQSIISDYFVELALVALAQMLVMIVRGIDLSVGGVISLSVVMTGLAVTSWGMNIWVAVVFGLLIGAIAGFCNGVLIAYGKLPPIIVTLGTGILTGGLAVGISHGLPYSGFPEDFISLGTGTTGSIPNQLFVLIVAALVIGFVLWRTRFGQWIYAVGGNESAAEHSGIPVARLKLIVYSCAGLLAAASGLILVAKLGTASAESGSLLIVFQSITAAILGGVAIEGGKGNVVGLLLGVLVLSVAFDAMTLNSVSSDRQNVVVGLVLLIAVFVDAIVAKRRVAT